MNIYEACKTYVELKAELNKVIKKKITSVEFEYYEDAAELFEQEKMIAEKLTAMRYSLEFAFSDPGKLGISSHTKAPFSCSLLDTAQNESDPNNERSFLRKIAIQNSEDPSSNRLVRLYEYFSVENWIEFFIERKEWLAKRIKDKDISNDQREILNQELKQIEQDMFHNPQSLH